MTRALFSAMFGPCACEPAERWLMGYAHGMAFQGTEATTVTSVNAAWAYRPRCQRRRCRAEGPLTDEVIAAYLSLAPENEQP